MSTAIITNRIAGISPRAKARVAGICEFFEGLLSAYGQVSILGSLVVAGNSAATAANILGHQQLFWFGFAISVLGAAFHIAWGYLFYELFKPVNASIARFAAFTVILCSAMQAVTALLYAAPMIVLQHGNSLSSFSNAQLQELMMFFLKLNNYAFEIDLVFFGLWCVLSGYLISKSTFMPRIIGVLLMIDGLGWMMYIFPQFAYSIFMVIAIASGLAEVPLQLWLIIMGVNSRRWYEQAGTTVE
ncbi:MAG TPA: DUF4386 domain-containing protein [Mucilaginibacter sp.]|jgi:hypothetical protein|nr:DUF4386 domain-containing protein [Mucilaginibacter sp.]